MRSPELELFRLARLYLKIEGKKDPKSDLWTAYLSGLLVSGFGGTGQMKIEYLHLGQYELVWTSWQGFQTEDWMPHLETLRKRLVLERLADA